VLVFMGRSVQWMLDGLAASCLSLLVLAPLFGVAIPWPAALGFVPLMVLVCLSCYMTATFFGSLALRLTDARNLIGVTMSTSLMLFCGVNVAVSSLPRWAAAVSNMLPVTHGLAAVRALLDGEVLVVVMGHAGREALVGLGWAVIAVSSFRHFAEGGRKDGSIEFGA
jgi:ABC-2 type transport system permease protein